MIDRLKAMTFGLHDMETAAGLSRKQQHNRALRNQWFTPIDPAGGGRRRVYRLEHIFEAAITTELQQCGIPVVRGLAVIERRLFYEHVRIHGHQTGFTGDAHGEILRLPEFQSADPENPTLWAVYLGPDGRAGVVAVLPVLPTAQLTNVSRGSTVLLVVNVTEIITRAINALAARHPDSGEDGRRGT